jgi:hypothetical protein
MFRMRMAAAMVGLSVLGPLAPTAAHAAPAPPQITLKVLSAFGSGCPAGTTDVVPNADNTAFSLAYSEFRVYGGDYKSCRVAIRVGVPAGWTYAVVSVVNRVTPNLSGKGSARLQMNAWFTGFPWNASDDHSVSGPKTKLWTSTSTADVLTYAPCDDSADLSVNDTLRISGPATDSAELIDTDARASTVFNLVWKKC